MILNTSQTILRNLVHNDDYARKVLPFLKDEYFQDNSEKQLYKIVNNFIETYNATPTIEALYLTVSEKNTFDEKSLKSISEVIEKIKDKPNDNISWLIDTTEKFCKNQAVYNGIMESIHIMDGKSKNVTVDAIPDILQKALSVSFDPKIGHDYFDNFLHRHEYYTRKEIKVPFRIDALNLITKGGISRKTLNMIIAGPNVGKTACMCSMAADNLMDGYNVLYITGEMSEEEIAKRIDANLLDLTTDMLEILPLKNFEKKIGALKLATKGKLIVKEYATASAHVGNFRQLFNELNLKKNFVPDVVYIDYMNIFLSSRHRGPTSDKSYGVVKSISEEFRGLAVEMNLAMWTATQFNRVGHGNTDPDEGDIADSFGPIMTADLVLAAIRTENLAKANQIMFKQLKSRYGDKHFMNKFTVGFESSKMKLFNLDDPLLGVAGANSGNANTTSVPIFDRTKVGMESLKNHLETVDITDLGV